MKIKFITVMSILVLGLVNSFALEITMISNMPQVITNVNLSHYDVGVTGKGPTMFTITIIGDNKSYEDLHTLYQVHVEGYVLGSGEQMIYEAITTEFDLNPQESFTVISNDYFMKASSARTHRKKTNFMMDNNQVRDMILNSGTIPTGFLRYTVILRDKANNTLGKAEIRREIRNISSLELLNPGVEVDQSEADLPKIYTPYPNFKWHSDIDRENIYGNADIYEFKLFKKENNYNLSEVLASRPVYTTRTNKAFLQYPIGAQSLVPGGIYYWQVTLFLKGIIDAEMKSKVFAFKYEDLVAAQANPEMIQVHMDIESILTGSNCGQFLQMIKEYKDGAEITIDGKKVDRAFLSDLSRLLLTGNFELTDNCRFSE